MELAAAADAEPKTALAPVQLYGKVLVTTTVQQLLLSQVGTNLLVLLDKQQKVTTTAL